MDVFDRAQEQEEFFWDKSLARQLARTKPLPGIAKEQDCEDCGKPIPAKRLKAYPAATRCVACQMIEENKNKFGDGA